jgi:hypothetical protein
MARASAEIVVEQSADGWGSAIVDLLARAHRMLPGELATEINAATRPLGVAVTVYLVDHEQERLWPLPEDGKPTPPPCPVEETTAGRAFTAVQSQVEGDRPYQLWVPIVDGSERLGVAEAIAHRPPDDPVLFQNRCETLIGLVGHLVTVKLPYEIRHGQVVKVLTGGRRMPLGIDDRPFELGEEILEREDRLLLYTDGVTEAYDRDGRRFGADRLADLAQRCMADRLPAPETLRRLGRTVLAHQGRRPVDDATLLLLEWSGEAAERTQP